MYIYNIYNLHYTMCTYLHYTYNVPMYKQCMYYVHIYKQCVYIYKQCVCIYNRFKKSQDLFTPPISWLGYLFTFKFLQVHSKCMYLCGIWDILTQAYN